MARGGKRYGRLAQAVKVFRQDYPVESQKRSRLGENIQNALRQFLTDAGIQFLDVSFRVKTLDSAVEKIKRKKYYSPLNDMEDFCGLRIICYSYSDLDRIADLIEGELVSHERVNKEDLLDYKEFGYRSLHLIVSIPESWTASPNFRGLSGVRMEIQIRTVLMHAWAEIEHKLAYKSKDQAPRRIGRKLSLLSAKLGEIDEQFDEIRQQSASYRKDAASKAESTGRFDTSLPLDLDSLLSLLDFYFPSRDIRPDASAELVSELAGLDINIEEIVNAIEKAKPLLPRIEEEAFHEEGISAGHGWAQVGALRSALDVGLDKYYKWRLNQIGEFDDWREPVDRWRKTIQREADGG